MDFSFTDEQQMLQDATRRFVASEYAFEHRAKVLASDAGWSREAWQSLADLGLLLVDMPEADGGIDAGADGVMLVAQALGEGLLLEPFLASAVLATQAIARLGSEAQRGRWLPAMGEGRMIAVLVHVHPVAVAGGDAEAVRAEATADGWRLHGRVAAVQHAAAADLLLVAAGVDGGLGLFAVPADAAGLRLTAQPTLDGQPAADVALDAVVVAAGARLGGEARGTLDAVMDHGLAVLCADALGVLERTLRATIDYSRSRLQFGSPIGSFQALQHRMADMLMQVEQARSMTCLAIARSGDPDPAARAAALSAAKVIVGQAARRVGEEAVQLHGGMGMTDELDVSHCFRRLLAFELRFGTTAAHLAARRRALAAHVAVDTIHTPVTGNPYPGAVSTANGRRTT